MKKTHSINQTAVQLSTSRSKIYKLLSAGKLDALKMGDRTIITDAAINKYLATLPAAIFSSAA